MPTATTPLIPPVLTSAPPPWHAVVLLMSMVSLFVSLLPSLESLDQRATMQTFSNIIFPNYLSLQHVAYIRLSMATIIFALSTQTMLGPGWTQETVYRQDSKLVRAPNRLTGIRTMFPFTSVAWNVLGLAFGLSGYIALQVVQQVQNGALLGQVSISPWLLRSALVTWEMAAPFTLLVASVIRYAIWPAVLKAQTSTANLKTFRNIMMHNLNVAMALTEVALLGGISVQWQDVAFAPLVGCAYVVFSWCMVHSWNDATKGPQFIYYFFDTTRGQAASVALIVLLCVLVLFYAMFCSVEYIL